MSSYIADATNAKVALVKAHKMGGDCMNYGCVPSKALIKKRHAERYGLKATAPAIPFARVMARVHQVIADIAPMTASSATPTLGSRC